MKLIAVLALAFSSVALAEEKAALGGYCPVCYIAAGKAVKGSSEFTAEHEGKTYWFVNQEAVETFKGDPEKYLPQYDGYCAYGMALGKKFDSDPTVFKVVDGRLFLNKNADVGKLFEKDTADLVKKADVEWKKMH